MVEMALVFAIFVLVAVVTVWLWRRHSRAHPHAERPQDGGSPGAPSP